MMYAVDVMGSNDWGDGPVVETGYDFTTLEDAHRWACSQLERACDARGFLTAMSAATGGYDESEHGPIELGAQITGADDSMGEHPSWMMYPPHWEDLWPLHSLWDSSSVAESLRDEYGAPVPKSLAWKLGYTGCVG